MSRARVIPIQATPNVLGEPVGPLKGRGTAWAMPHRFHTEARVPEDDGWSSPTESAGGAGDDAETPPPAVPTRIVEDRAGQILARNDSPDIGFDLSINPYRGCEHGCIYCYARPTHSYLNLSPGIDFETHILAKTNAAERLRAAFARPGFRPQSLNIGSATDAYQPAERRLQITRQVLEVLVEHRHPFSIITKSSLVERDLDLIAPMAAEGRAAVFLSVTSLDASLSRILEPRAASPQRRLKTIATLAAAGVPVGVSVSPVIPFINEPELERILQAAADAGASSAFSVVLRLPWEVAPLFRHWLEQHHPQRAARVMARVQEMRGGRDNDSRFGARMTGEGVWAQLLRQRFDKACARLGLAQLRPPLDLSGFRVPGRVPGAPSGGRAAAPHEAATAIQRSLF